MDFFKAADLKPKQILKGITLKAVFGNNTMLTFFEFEPNAIIPGHQHPHEQITYILEGELEFTCAGQTKILKAGEGVVLSSNEPHSARVLNKPAKVIDAWHPIREDYIIK